MQQSYRVARRGRFAAVYGFSLKIKLYYVIIIVTSFQENICEVSLRCAENSPGKLELITA